MELERVNQPLKEYFATSMCKKGARNEVFELLGHFPESQKLVEKVAFFLIKPGLDKFSTVAGGCQMELKHGF